jgi:putative transposase
MKVPEGQVKAVLNLALAILWPYLDEFGSKRAGPARKQMGKYIGFPKFH